MSSKRPALYGFKPGMKLLTVANTLLYRATKGRVGGTWHLAGGTGQPVLLLTTIGRKSGEPRTVPLLYLERDGEYVVVASQAGSRANPAWYLNLRDTPDVTVEITGAKRNAVARVAAEEERAALWPELVKFYPPYQDYQTWTERVIPVVSLVLSA